LGFNDIILFCLTAVGRKVKDEDEATPTVAVESSAPPANDDDEPIIIILLLEGAVLASGDEAVPLVCFMCSHSIRSRFHKARRMTSRNCDHNMNESFEGLCQNRNVQLKRNRMSASKMRTETATPYRNRFRNKLYQQDDVVTADIDKECWSLDLLLLLHAYDWGPMRWSKQQQRQNVPTAAAGDSESRALLAPVGSGAKPGWHNSEAALVGVFIMPQSMTGEPKRSVARVRVSEKVEEKNRDTCRLVRQPKKGRTTRKQKSNNDNSSKDNTKLTYQRPTTRNNSH
jgi:hypothetical protein